MPCETYTTVGDELGHQIQGYNERMALLMMSVICTYLLRLPLCIRKLPLPLHVRQVSISLACSCSALREDHQQPAAAADVQHCTGLQQRPVQVLTCLELAGAGPAVPGTGCTGCH